MQSLERQASGLAVWTWNKVERPHEAGELIFLVVNSAAPLDEQRATEFYLRATGQPLTDPNLSQ